MALPLGLIVALRVAEKFPIALTDSALTDGVDAAVAMPASASTAIAAVSASLMVRLMSDSLKVGFADCKPIRGPKLRLHAVPGPY